MNKCNPPKCIQIRPRLADKNMEYNNFVTVQILLAFSMLGYYYINAEKT